MAEIRTKLDEYYAYLKMFASFILWIGYIMAVIYCMSFFVQRMPTIETPTKIEIDVTAVNLDALVVSVSYLLFMALFFAQSKFVTWFIENHENNATLMLTLTNLLITCLMLLDIIYKQIHLQ